MASQSNSNFSLSSSPYNSANTIDLTLDDDIESADSHYERVAKRLRTEYSPIPHSAPPTTRLPFQSHGSTPTSSPPASGGSFINGHPPAAFLQGPQPTVSLNQYRPAFAGPSSFPTRQQRPASSASPSPATVNPATVESERQVIDLTGSPSPPPIPQARFPVPPGLPVELPPKTPVCIGLLTVTALVLYPVPYLYSQHPNSNEAEWAPVRLHYDHSHNKPGGPETIHIRTPNIRGLNGEIIDGEDFGVVEQKVATALGPMLGKGLIRLDAKVRKGLPNLPILPLQMLVYTPKGNIPVVGGYLHGCGLFLDHPTSQDFQCPVNCHYYNPHSPPPGGFNRAVITNRMGFTAPVTQMRWSTPTISGKSVEVQRSQVDELFKSLKSGDELLETEPSSEVATRLYPHQKKALTFLLERERERVGVDGKYSSLWQTRHDPVTRSPFWFHVVTQKEVLQEPPDCKGAILADDMGLGKTITCVSLMAATLHAAQEFSLSPFSLVNSRPDDGHNEAPLSASHFAGSVWGMPEVPNAGTSAKAKAKAMRQQEKLESEFARASRIKAKSRATLIICPLSTVSNWEDQFREHWRGEVTVIGGAGGICAPIPPPAHCSLPSPAPSDVKSEPNVPVARVREGRPLRVYVYHGNARRPEPEFLADFDAVITTYATLASEFSKQNRRMANAEADDEEEDGSSDGGGVDIDEHGNQVLRLPKAKKTGLKRKKSSLLTNGAIESTSPLQSIYWFRVVLDEAHSIKEISTVASRASCDLMADRRLCLTGTPVQNKLDDVFALIKFLRLDPFDDKNVWTEFIGTPVKYGQALGVARLQTIMKCITLRRTKESKTQNGQKILSLPPRRDELRYLKFDQQEQEIYDRYFNESKAEFNELSTNEVMKNYVGILQKILRLRQICDHFELVDGKGLSVAVNGQSQDSAESYEVIVSAIMKEGINVSRACAIFALLRESATTQCVECGVELGAASDNSQIDGSGVTDLDGPLAPKRGRKPKAAASRGPTRANSPFAPRPVLTRCQHLFCIECYRNCICPGWPNVSADLKRSCSACQTGLSPSDAVEVKPDFNPDTSAKKKPIKREKRQKGMAIDNFHPSTKVKALLGDLAQFSRTNPFSVNYEPEAVELQMVDDKGNDVGDGVVKTVVFSQWTSMLDKIEDALETAGICYDRLDGTMKRDERARAMDSLKYDPRCEVLLVSLKAGGVGLNLTAAQRVYLMDPYWNPAVENQAVDRIHRLGQTRPVTTVKLIIENSIEARLLEVQRKKTELANMTLGQGFSKADMLHRRMEELHQLLS